MDLERLDFDSLILLLATRATNCFYWIRKIARMMADDSVVALSKNLAPALVMTLPFDWMGMVRCESTGHGC